MLDYPSKINQCAYMSSDARCQTPLYYGIKWLISENVSLCGDKKVAYGGQSKEFYQRSSRA